MSQDTTVKAKLVGMGVGLKVPATSLAANVINGFYLELEYGGVSTVYGVASLLDVDQGGLVVYGVATDPFEVQFDFSKGLHPDKLDGKLVDLNIDAGIVIANWGSVDIKLTIYDSYNAPLLSIERVDVPADGVMVADAKVRGNLVNLSKPAK